MRKLTGLLFLGAVACGGTNTTPNDRPDAAPQIDAMPSPDAPPIAQGAVQFTWQLKDWSDQTEKEIATGCLTGSNTVVTYLLPGLEPAA